MPSPIRVRRTLFHLTAALALTLSLPAANAAEAWTLDRLMAQLGSHRAGQARFTERKYLAILDQPVESSGELRFRAPDRLEKVTLKPKPESLVLDGDTLTITRGKQQLSARIGDFPEVAAFIDSIRATLAGDRAALERTYGLHLAGNSARWTLSLLPRDPRLAEKVLRINLTGTAGRLAGIEILQGDGDRSVMDITALEGQP